MGKLDKLKPSGGWGSKRGQTLNIFDYSFHLLDNINIWQPWQFFLFHTIIIKSVAVIIFSEGSESLTFWMVSLVLVSFVSSNVLVATEYNVLIRNYSPNYRGKDLVFTKERKKKTQQKAIKSEEQPSISQIAVP